MLITYITKFVNIENDINDVQFNTHILYIRFSIKQRTDIIKVGKSSNLLCTLIIHTYECMHLKPFL